MFDFMPRLIAKHKDTEFTLSISLDGPEEIHDKVRVFKGAYKKALETIDAMSVHRNKSNFYLKLASVLTKDNNHFMESFLNTTSKWNIDFHEIILIRDVPVEEIIVKPGQTSLSRDEIIVSFQLPNRPPKSGDAYLRFTPRTEMDIAVVGIGTYVQLNSAGDKFEEVNVSLASVAPTPIYVQEISEFLLGAIGYHYEKQNKTKLLQHNHFFVACFTILIFFIFTLFGLK